MATLENNNGNQTYLLRMTKLSINLYKILFNKNASNRFKFMLKIQGHLMSYLMIKYAFITSIILIQNLFGDNILYFISLSSILSSIGGPACHNREKLLTGTTMVAVFCLIIGKPYQHFSKEVSKCEFYFKIADQNLFIKRYLSTLTSNINLLKESSKLAYNRSLGICSKHIKHLVTLSYMNHMSECQSLQDNISLLLPQNATDNYDKITSYKLILSIVNTISSISIFVYMILFLEDEITYLDGSIDYESKKLDKEDFLSSNVTFVTINTSKCYYSSLETIILFYVLFFQSHSLSSFCVLMAHNHWEEVKDYKRSMKKQLDIMNSIIASSRVTPKCKPRKELIGTIEKLRQVEYHLLSIFIWTGSTQIRMKQSIELANKMLVSSSYFLVIYGSLIFAYRFFGLIERSGISFVVILLFSSNSILYMFKYFNKTYEDFICRDFLTLAAKLVRVNQDVVDEIIRFDVKTTYAFATKKYYYNHLSDCCCYSEKTKQIVSINKDEEDDGDNLLTLYFDFTTLQPTVINPFTLIMWRKRLQYLDIVKRKYTTSLGGKPIDQNIILNVSMLT